MTFDPQAYAKSVGAKEIPDWLKTAAKQKASSNGQGTVKQIQNPHELTLSTGLKTVPMTDTQAQYDVKVSKNQNVFQQKLQKIADTVHTIDAYKQAASAALRDVFLPGTTVTKVAPSVEESLRFAVNNAERRGRSYIVRGTGKNTDYANGLDRNINAYNIIGAANFKRVNENGKDYYHVQDVYDFKDYDKQGKQILGSGSNSQPQWDYANKLVAEGFNKNPFQGVGGIAKAIPHYVESLMAKKEEYIGNNKSATRYDLKIPVMPEETGNSKMYQELGLNPPAGSYGSNGFTPTQKASVKEQSTAYIPPTVYIPPKQTSIPTQSYQVKAGDNLTHISEQLGVDINQLAKQNNIRNVNQLNVGQTLRYQAPSDVVKKASTDALNWFLGKKTNKPVNAT